MTEQPGFVAPAGWYVDPTTSILLRWWSGLAWTEHVAPIPEVSTTPDDYRTAAPTKSPVPAVDLESAHAGAADDNVPLPPPPISRLAPVSAYGWAREESKTEIAPRWTLPVGHSLEFTAIPSRWGSVSVWVIAFAPWMSVAAFFVMLLLEGIGAQLWLQYAAVSLPWLITLAAAQRDVKRLSGWGHRTVAPWAWALLGAPAYLIARTVVLRRTAGLGSAPLWVWIANFLLVVGLGVFIVVVFAAVLASLSGSGFDGTQLSSLPTAIGLARLV